MKLITVPAIVLSSILLVVFLWLAVLTLTTPTPEQGDWVCLQQVCSNSEPGGLLWAEQNCGFVNDTQTGTQVEACQVTINGQTQLIPRTEINLSAIRNCVEYTCVQEVRVRNTNYTINSSE